MDKAEIANATTFEMFWGKRDQEKFTWEILAEGDHITEDPLDIPEEAQFKIDMDISRPLDELFFEYFFPDVTGHGKIIDEYLSSPQAKYHDTCQTDKIVFHDETNDDPDWKVKQGYMIMIAAACEIENGIENLWKKGPSGGRHMYPDFGKYMPKNMFKCFVSAAPFCW